MSDESKLAIITAALATVIANQATILTHVDASGGGDGTDIEAELKALSEQVAAINTTLGDEGPTAGAAGVQTAGTDVNSGAAAPKVA